MITNKGREIIIDKLLFETEMFWYDDESERIESVMIESVIYDRDDNIAVMVLGEDSLLMELSYDLLADTPEKTIEGLENDYDIENAKEALNRFLNKDEDADS